MIYVIHIHIYTRQLLRGWARTVSLGSRVPGEASAMRLRARAVGAGASAARMAATGVALSGHAWW